MKIAVIHFALTTESGDTRMILSIGKTLRELGHTVTAYAAEFDPEKCFPRLHRDLRLVVVPPARPFSSLYGAIGFFRKILERLRRTTAFTDQARRIVAALDPDFDFVICENDYSYKIACDYKKINPRATIIWIMNNPPFFHGHKKNFLVNFASIVSAWFEKRSALRFAPFIDWIIVYDSATARYASLLHRPVKTLGNPIDTERFCLPVRMRDFSKRSVHLLSVGALSPQRRFEDTIRAVFLLRKQGYDARATLVCKDFWSNSDYRTSFEKYIHDSMVGEYIDARFSGATDDELFQLYTVCDFFVFPNNVPIWGVAAFEAMAAGMPAIVCRVTDVARVLHDGVNASFVDPLSPEQIVQKIVALTADSTAYLSLATAGQRFVLDHYDLKTYVQEILRKV